MRKAPVKKAPFVCDSCFIYTRPDEIAALKTTIYSAAIPVIIRARMIAVFIGFLLIVSERSVFLLSLIMTRISSEIFRKNVYCVNKIFIVAQFMQ